MAEPQISAAQGTRPGRAALEALCGDSPDLARDINLEALRNEWEPPEVLHEPGWSSGHW